jgi:hypothetical protein
MNKNVDEKLGGVESEFGYKFRRTFKRARVLNQGLTDLVLIWTN